MSGLRRADAADLQAVGWTWEQLIAVHEEARKRDWSVRPMAPWAVQIQNAYLVYKTDPVREIQRVFESMPWASPVIAYCDGSGTTFEKPAGIGAYLDFGPSNAPLLIAQNIGLGTNNVAELCAIWAALRHVRDPASDLLICSDSEYALGSVDASKGWVPKVNPSLVANIRTDLSWRRNVRFMHVDGHSKIEGNETADSLAKIGRKWVTAVTEYER